MFRSAAITLTLCLTAITAQGSLVSRAAGQAYYDTDLNITWLANANAGAGTAYDDGTSTTDGRMTWVSTHAWIASLNAVTYLGVGDWRLPTVTDTGAPGCVGYAFHGTDCGYNVDLSSEMAHLYYSTLGNVAEIDPSGSTDCLSG